MLMTIFVKKIVYFHLFSLYSRRMTENFEQKYLKVDDIHTVAYRLYGNKNGIPLLMFHGGPGGDIDYGLLELIDLNAFYVVTISQRGCGLSTPFGELRHNTTQELIEDIEKIRQAEGLGKCVIFGRSWGTSLALLYALCYPQNCAYLVLRGIFLARDEDEDWTLRRSATVYPKEWKEFARGFNSGEPLNVQLYEKIVQAPYQKALPFSQRLSHYFEILATNNPQAPLREETLQNLTANKIFLHYSVNHYFLEPDFMAKNLPNLDKHHLCGTILHGGADNDCLVSQAQYLHQQWQGSQLIIEPSAPHCDKHQGIRQHLQNIFKQVAQEVSV